MMSWDGCFSALLLLGFIGLVAPTSISDSVFESHGSTTGRSLLQAKKSCPVNFEFENYSIITSRCKGPKYDPKPCCAAFVEFACPHADEINDLTNDCASTMFSYINLYGKYPPGLFASECQGEKQGLACPADPPGQSADDKGKDKSKGQIAQTLSPFLITAGFLVLLFQFF